MTTDNSGAECTRRDLIESAGGPVTVITIRSSYQNPQGEKLFEVHASGDARFGQQHFGPQRESDAVRTHGSLVARYEIERAALDSGIPPQFIDGVL